MKLKKYFTTVIDTVAKSPVESGLSLIFFIISQYLILYKEAIKRIDELTNRGAIEATPYYNELTCVLSYFFVAIAISYSLKIIFGKSRRIIYYLSILTPMALAAIFILLLPEYEMSHEPYLITIGCSLLLMYAAKNLIDNRAFALNAIRITINLVTSGFLALLTCGIAISIVYSICHIVNVGMASYVYTIILYISLFIVYPLLFLILEQKSDKEIMLSGKTESILFNYILTPSIVIYGIILYIYFAKVIILWELPKGVISTTAIIFIAGGVFVSACRTVLHKRILDWVFNYFTYISIPALVLLWVSAIHRIAEYGFTDSRIYLLLTIITLTLWMVAILSKRFGRFQYLAQFTIITFMLFTLVPIKVGAERSVVEVEMPRVIHLYNESFKSLDIEAYKIMESASGNYKTKIANDYVFITDLDDNEIIKIHCDELLDSIFINAGMDSYKTMNPDSIDNNRNIPLIYSDDEHMLIFTLLYFQTFKGKFAVHDVSLDYMLCK